MSTKMKFDCVKFNICAKINTILDKDMESFQYVDSARKVCNACGEKVIAPKEKGIQMSAMMVKQLLNGKKTHTRRLMNPQPTFDHYYTRPDGSQAEIWQFKDSGLGVDCDPSCARYHVGNKIYIKERHKILSVNEIAAGIGEVEFADGVRKQFKYEPDSIISFTPNRFRSSMFLPKAASRLWRVVTHVKSQRLSDMTDEDAMDEGMDETVAAYLGLSMADYSKDCGSYYLRIYKAYWDFLNAKNGHPFSANDWIWDYELRDWGAKVE